MQLHTSSKVYLYGDEDIEFGRGKIKGTSQETVLMMGKNAVWNVRGGVLINGSAKINIQNNGILDTDMFSSSPGLMLSVDKKVTLGKDIMIGGDVYICDSDFHQIQNSKNEQINIPKEVVIGNHVWLGVRSAVYKAKIGENSIVASYTVVKKNVPENSMVSMWPDCIRITRIGKTIHWERKRVLKHHDVFRKSKIILYGYGMSGKAFAKKYEKQIAYIIDNNVKEKGVCTFEEFTSLYQVVSGDDVWVIASDKYYEQMHKQILTFYPEAVIYFAE